MPLFVRYEGKRGGGGAECNTSRTTYQSGQHHPFWTYNLLIAPHLEHFKAFFKVIECVYWGGSRIKVFKKVVQDSLCIKTTSKSVSPPSHTHLHNTWQKHTQQLHCQNLLPINLSTIKLTGNIPKQTPSTLYTSKGNVFLIPIFLCNLN